MTAKPDLDQPMTRHTGGHPDTDRMVEDFERRKAAMKTEMKRAVVCRHCGIVDFDPVDTWRCRKCKHTNVLDVTEVPVK